MRHVRERVNLVFREALPLVVLWVVYVLYLPAFVLFGGRLVEESDGGAPRAAGD